MSASSSFPPKLIVTSAIKQQAVQKLFDYWTTKTQLLRKKHNPSLANDDDLTEQNTEFLEDNSNLKDQPFWGKLTGLSRVKATNLFGVQEVSGLQKMRLQKDKMKAAVYIVLSGTASVTKGGEQESVVYGPGQVFGALDMFNRVVENHNNYDSLQPEYPDDIVEFENGTFLRMELADLYNRVLNPIDDEEPDTREEDEAIAGIAWEELTEDDKFYIRVYKRTKELVNKNFFSFLDAYRMVPKNAMMPAYKYYNEGSLGRELYLHEDDPTYVLVIIDGRLRVDVCPTRANSGPHYLSCKRRGIRPMQIKTKSMPLMLLTSGSIMCIQPSTFRIGRESLGIDHHEPSDFGGGSVTSPSFAAGGSVVAEMTVATKASRMDRSLLSGNTRTTTGRSTGRFVLNKRRMTSDARKPTATANIMSKSLNAPLPGVTLSPRVSSPPMIKRVALEASIESSQTGFLSSYSLNTFNSVDSKVHKKAGKFVAHKEPADVPGAEYDIKLIFEHMTTYLAIPLANFEKLLYDDKLVLPKIAREIRWHLAHSDGTIAERIKRLLPWIQGDIAFKPMDKFAERHEKVNFTPSDPGNLQMLPGDDLNLTQGSFYIPQCEPILNEEAVETLSSRAQTKSNTQDAIMQSMLQNLRQQQMKTLNTNPALHELRSASEASEVSSPGFDAPPLQMNQPSLKKQSSIMTDTLSSSNSADYAGFITTDVEGERIRTGSLEKVVPVDRNESVIAHNLLEIEVTPSRSAPKHARSVSFCDSRASLTGSHDGDDHSAEVDLNSVSSPLKQ